jgi:hypothetical protein
MMALWICLGAVVTALASLGLAVVIKVVSLMLRSPKSAQASLNDAQNRIAQAQRLMARARTRK